MMILELPRIFAIVGKSAKYASKSAETSTLLAMICPSSVLGIGVSSDYCSRVVGADRTTSKVIEMAKANASKPMTTRI